MITQTGNIWHVKHRKLNCWTGITTNGYINAQGALVMGRGVALQAKQRFPGIEFRIANYVRECGNLVYPMPDLRLFTFPVKHTWNQDADIELIAKSSEQLQILASFNLQDTFYLPRPGCGNGNLQWKDVEPILEPLPDNVIVINWG